MKFFKKLGSIGFRQEIRNQRIAQKVQNRVGNLRRKLSKGAADIFRIMKTHAKWGNKQLWGFRERGRHKPR